MNKTPKWSLLIIGVFTVTVIFVLLALPYLISTEKFKKPLVNQISSALNREVSINEVRLSLFPWVGLHCTDIQILEEGSNQGKLLVLNALDIKIRFFSLIRGNPQIGEIRLNEPNLQIIRLPQGQTNLTTLLDSTPKSEISEEQPTLSAFLLGLTISEFSISNGIIRLIDQTDPQNSSGRELKNININLKNVSFTRPMDVSLSLEMEEIPKTPISYKGQIFPDLKGGKITLENNRIRLGEIELLLSGSISEIQTNPAFSILLQDKQLPLDQAVLLAKALNIPVSPDLDLEGTGSLDATLQGPTDHLNIFLKLSLEDSSLTYKNVFKKEKGLPSEISFQTSWVPESPEKGKFNFDYLIMGLTQTDPSLNVSLQGQGTLDRDNHFILFKNPQGNIEDLQFTFEGTLSQLNSNPEIQFDLEGKNLSNKKISSLAKVFKKPLPPQIEMGGDSTLKVSIKGLLEEFTMMATLSIDASYLTYENVFRKKKGEKGYLTVQTLYKPKSKNWSSIKSHYSLAGHTGKGWMVPISLTGKGLADLEQQILTIENNHITMNGLEITLYGKLTHLNNIPELDIVMKGSTLSLENLTAILKSVNISTPPNLQVEGTGNLMVSFLGPIKKLNISGKGNFNKTQMIFAEVIRKESGIPTGLKFDLLSTPNQLEIYDFELKGANSDLTLKGQWTYSPLTHLDFVVSSNYLEGQGWLFPALQDAPSQKQGEKIKPLEIQTKGPNPPALKAKVDLNFKKGTLRGIPFSDLTGTLTLDQGILSINPFALNLAGGPFEGNYTLDLNGSSPSFQLSAKSEGPDLHQLFLQTKLKDKVYGRLFGQISLDGKGNQWEETRKNLHGNGNILIKEAYFPSLQLLEGISSLLGVSLKDLGFQKNNPFQELNGSFVMETGEIKTNDLNMNMRGLTLSAKGKLGLDQTLSLRIMAKMGPQIADLLPLPTGLTKTFFKNNRVGLLVPFNLTGTWSEPKISTDTKGLVDLATQGIIDKTIDVIPDVFKDLFKKK
ncbi:MAG TPA: AsmA family protein [Nitrospiria bacterium]|jgi:uncharacterized protein involved in outer membrane biogenesis